MGIILKCGVWVWDVSLWRTAVNTDRYLQSIVLISLTSEAGLGNVALDIDKSSDVARN